MSTDCPWDVQVDLYFSREAIEAEQAAAAPGAREYEKRAEPVEPVGGADWAPEGRPSGLEAPWAERALPAGGKDEDWGGPAPSTEWAAAGTTTEWQ